ncbi:hypothetical protein AJO04nite_24930 [Acinetobacter johnsonii]|uniref:Uncharacterized protein n=2 Tax=Acinetobacter johnsonii TaxID=40214 RepID=A0AAV3WFU0_ACIJO|nr:hypothetical protein AJO04nite_24930 [Acinetobacter johnsonii]
MSLKKHLFIKGAFFMMIRVGINKSVSKNWPLQLFLIQLDLMDLDQVRAIQLVKQHKKDVIGQGIALE